MKKISAFVGHSFTKEDDGVVAAVLRFLDTVEDLSFGFSWDHAEDAEPKELSDKVKAKMEGKNLFIGICTSKEWVANLADSSTPWYNKRVVQFETIKVARKTSDWVMQEIGYALGKGMDVILLLEEGTRRPGGLQGDLEHIPFTRDKPSEAFPKLLEMIRALTPRSVAVEASAAVPPPDEKVGDKAKTHDGLEEPKPSWTFSDYESAIWHAVIERSDARVQSLRDAFGQTAEGQSELQRHLLEAATLSLMSMMNRGGNVERLQELAAAHPTDRRFLNNLAQAYAEYGLHDKAAATHIRAAEVAEDEEIRLNSLASAAVQKMEDGDPKAEEWLRAEVSKLAPLNEQQRGSLLWALSELSHARVGLWVAYQEARLHGKPDDHDARFALAYKYSEEGNDAMALYHYLRIPIGPRNEGTWNNIGVSASALQLNIQSTAAYQRSRKMGGTRSVSNLAYKLIGIGFTSEAEQMCREALANPDCDGRVASALGSIQDEKQEQNEKQDKILEKADRERTFVAELGGCLMAPLPAGLHRSKWQAPDCEVEIIVGEHSFKASGKYSKVSGGLIVAALMRQSGMLASEAKRTTMLVTYEGEIRGRGVVARKVVREEGATQGAAETLLTATSGESVYILFNEELTAARELRRPEKADAVYSDWKRTG